MADRENQKQRTRAAIVEAATRLVRQGASPTVAEAAEEAKVSRATAYRYFPTPESLLLEVTGVTPAFEPLEQLVRELDGDDARARLDRFLEKANALFFAEEAQQRMALRVYLDTWFANRSEGEDAPPVREGRRMRLLAQVLQPLRDRLPPAQWRRLQAALALTVGSEAMVVMKDVCGLDGRAARDVLQWAAQALLKESLEAAKTADARRQRR